MIDGVICSPPYAESIKNGGDGIDWGKVKGEEGKANQSAGRGAIADGYGTAPGQLGAMRPGQLSEVLPPTNGEGDTPMETLTWHGCYDLSWNGYIVPEAFAHPAKMARGLLCRILDFMLEQGWLAKGQVLLDPFGGISTTAIEGASRGLKVITCELEPKFHALALRNVEIHRRTWEQFSDPLPVILQGDSRNLAALVGAAGACVSSPPYSNGTIREAIRVNKPDVVAGPNSQCMQPGYGHTPGNIANLPPGDLSAVVAADGLVSSPPWENTLIDHDSKEKYTKLREAMIRDGKGHEGQTNGTYFGESYGTTADNLGNTTGPTFWQASRDILLQCRRVLRPGSVSAWVVKNFVRNKAIVDFTGDWQRLLESCGFKVFFRVQASLVKEEAHAGLFGKVKNRKERKSFFRRLAEKKGSPRIDYESVLFARLEP